MCSLKFMTDWTSGLDKLTDLIDSESTNDYYKDMKINLIKGDNSMNTCFQYLIKSLKEGQDKEKDLLTRLKLYAKTIDLIEKEAVGKSVGSRIPLLLGADQHPDKDYYD